MNEESSRENDPLWEIARKRVDFRQSVMVYLVVNAFLWVIWFFTSSPAELEFSSIPWPIYPLFSWGLGLAIVYVHLPVPHKQNPVDKEYERLKSLDSHPR